MRLADGWYPLVMDKLKVLVHHKDALGNVKHQSQDSSMSDQKFIDVEIYVFDEKNLRQGTPSPWPLPKQATYLQALTLNP